MKIGQGILERRCRQEDLGYALCQIVQALGALCAMKHVPEVMRLVNNQEIPLYRRESLHQLGGIIIGRNNNARRFRIFDPSFCPKIIFLYCQAIQNSSFEAKLFIQLNFPLFPKCGRKRDKDSLCTCIQYVFKYKACLNGFSQADFIRQNNASGFQGMDRRDERIDLMRIHLNIRIQETTIGGFVQLKLLELPVLFQQQILFHLYSPNPAVP